MRRYLARDGSDIAWDLIRLAWASVADYAIAPLQDVLNLGTEATHELPGPAAGQLGLALSGASAQSVDSGSSGGDDAIYGRDKIAAAK